MISDILYLSGRYSSINEELEASIETWICLFIYSYCDMNFKINFIDTNEDYINKVQLKNWKIILDHNKFYYKDFNCTLPAIKSDATNTCIAGLCAVLRWAIKSHNILFPAHYSESLLGFRGGCLVACAESSIWTKFCELELPDTVKGIATYLKNGKYTNKIPEKLAVLEAHLKRPVRTHNILKRKLDIAKRIKQNNLPISNSKMASEEIELNFNLSNFDSGNATKISDLSSYLKSIVITEKDTEFYLNHCYLEGIDLTLADMIVFPSVYFLLECLPHEANVHLETVNKWFSKMYSNERVAKAANDCGFIRRNNKLSDNEPIIMPSINEISLYKRDPGKTKLRCKHQNPDKILSILEKANIHPYYASNYCSKLEWNVLPPVLHPSYGDLPTKRVERKCQQLESIVTAVLKIAVSDQIIAEFCAGGGHVGLLLAYFLPKCKIMLIENKESSLMRAKNRANALNLKNISFYQCNLDYFKGSFNIGVALHACGVATDLVIQRCLTQRAAFVCCPCCYGSIQNTHLLNYPLSQKFKDSGLAYEEYALLAHFADRTEINTPTAEKGELCMGLLDMDRVHNAKEYGYDVELTTLQPLSCSPKHNLLIGMPHR